MQDHFMDIKNTQELLSMARTGLWVIEICLLYTSDAADE